MSKISFQEVKHIAKLARLGLEEKEMEKIQEELISILDYVDQLKEVNIKRVELQKDGVFNRTRKDEALSYSMVNKLLRLFPNTENRYLRVKSVFKRKDEK